MGEVWGNCGGTVAGKCMRLQGESDMVGSAGASKHRGNAGGAVGDWRWSSPVSPCSTCRGTQVMFRDRKEDYCGGIAEKLHVHWHANKKTLSDNLPMTQELTTHV